MSDEARPVVFRAMGGDQYIPFLACIDTSNGVNFEKKKWQIMIQ